MHFHRITDIGDPLYGRAMALCEANFIREERRDADEQERVMKDPCYHPCTVEDGGTVGIVFFWESEEFIYLEHLCIDPECRSKGYGGRVLEFLKAFGKTVILEIEPVVNEQTQKRLSFYERNGFVRNEHFHLNPKYHVGDGDLVLWLMTYDRPITKEEYRTFAAFIEEHVQIRQPQQTAEQNKK
ncbi:MAG: GNAT family N-acetyltransferase [Eubacteriales bacterium]